MNKREARALARVIAGDLITSYLIHPDTLEARLKDFGEADYDALGKVDAALRDVRAHLYSTAAKKAGTE